MKFVLLIFQGTTPLPGSKAWESMSQAEQNQVYADYAELEKTLGVTRRPSLGTPGRRKDGAGGGRPTPGSRRDLPAGGRRGSGLRGGAHGGGNRAGGEDRGGAIGGSHRGAAGGEVPGERRGGLEGSHHGLECVDSAGAPLGIDRLHGGGDRHLHRAGAGGADRVWVSYLPLLPLALLVLSGLYLFALPYAVRWRGRSRNVVQG